MKRVGEEKRNLEGQDGCSAGLRAMARPFPVKGIAGRAEEAAQQNVVLCSDTRPTHCLGGGGQEGAAHR